MGAKDIRTVVLRGKRTLSIELKEIRGKHKRGARVADVAKLHGRSSSIIYCILKKKEEIKKFGVAIKITMITKQRPQVLEDIEKLLLVLINEKQ